MIKALPQNRKRLASGIADNIRSDIEDRKLSPGSCIPTAKELAAIYKVSHVTANRALEALVAEGLVYRIKGHGSFVAESPNMPKTYTIGLAYPSRMGEENDVHAAFDVFSDTVMDRLTALGHKVKTLSKHDILESEGKALQEVDGIIISPDFVYIWDVQDQLVASGKPVVLIRNTNYQDIPCHQVITDVNTGFRQAVELFVSLGHKQLIVADCEGVEESLIRRQGFIRCAEREGVPSENIKVVSKPRMVGDLGRMAGRQIGEDIIASGIDHPAVFSVGDFISFGIVDALHAHGLEVGRDIDLISFDDLEDEGLCPFGEPILTSVSFPRKKISSKAVDFLLDQINNRDGTLHVLRVPTELIIRKSAKMGNLS